VLRSSLIFVQIAQLLYETPDGLCRFFMGDLSYPKSQQVEALGE